MLATSQLEALDCAAITQVLIQERQARDSEWWDEVPGYYEPGATIRTSWFDGSVDEYVERSKVMNDQDRVTHRVGVPAVRVGGDRAVADMPMTITFRGDLRGAEVDLNAEVRFLARLRRRDGRWRLLSLEAIFERDALTPTVPGVAPHITAEELARFRPSYRMLALYLTERGHEVADNRTGTDRPAEVADLYRQAHKWAGLTAH